MNRYIKNITSFLLNNTVWIYLTLFLFFSHLLNVSMVKETLGNYVYYFFAIACLYLPVVLYAFFRKQLSDKLPNWLSNLLWFYCFMVHPALLHMFSKQYFEGLFPIDNYMYGTEDKDAFRVSFHPTISISVLATEIGIQLSSNLRAWFKRKAWSQRLGLDELLFLFVIFLSCAFGLAANVEMIERLRPVQLSGFFRSIPRWIYYSGQCFLALSGYYGFYYVNKHYLIPQFLSKKGMVHYGFMMVLTILIGYPILTQLIRLLPIVHEIPADAYTDLHPFAKDRGLFPAFIILMSLPVIVAMQWFEQNSQIANLEKEKSATELNLLKQQINPHFFFNTLNNLYALSIVKDKQTPEVIMQLSELMRYVIYKGKEETVLLKEETKYIEDYIQLQQIRLHKKLDFRFDKQIENADLAIPPLLFITFVENAFKHGIEPAEKDCFLHLSLKSDGQQLVFTCANSMEEKNNAPAGIGLQNLRRRMALRFPNQHEIVIEETANHFKATLRIPDFTV